MIGGQKNVLLRSVSVKKYTALL